MTTPGLPKRRFFLGGQCLMMETGIPFPRHNATNAAARHSLGTFWRREKWQGPYVPTFQVDPLACRIPPVRRPPRTWRSRSASSSVGKTKSVHRVVDLRTRHARYLNTSCIFCKSVKYPRMRSSTIVIHQNSIHFSHPQTEASDGNSFFDISGIVVLQDMRFVVLKLNTITPSRLSWLRKAQELRRPKTICNQTEHSFGVRTRRRMNWRWINE
jgi:hypothetical protein